MSLKRHSRLLQPLHTGDAGDLVVSACSDKATQILRAGELAKAWDSKATICGDFTSRNICLVAGYRSACVQMTTQAFQQILV